MEEKIRDLANDIDIFSYNYNPYEYHDNVDDRDRHVENICGWICDHDEGMLKWLQDVTENDPGSEDAVEAAKLIARIEEVTRILNGGINL